MPAERKQFIFFVFRNSILSQGGIQFRIDEYMDIYVCAFRKKKENSGEKTLYKSIKSFFIGERKGIKCLEGEGEGVRVRVDWLITRLLLKK